MAVVFMWSFDVPNEQLTAFLEMSAEGRAIQRRLGADRTRVWSTATGKDVGRIIVVSEFENWTEMGEFLDRQARDPEWHDFIERVGPEWGDTRYWRGVMEELPS